MIKKDIVLPSNIQAESAVLGAIINDNKSFYEISELIETNDFYNDAHRVIFNSIKGLLKDNNPVDLITLTDKLKSDSALDQAGGMSYVASLCDALPDPSSIIYYANIVVEASKKRKLIDLGYKTIGEASNEASRSSVIIEAISGEFLNLAAGKKDEDDWKVSSAFEKELSEREDGQPVILTGFNRLDVCLGGLEPGQLVVFAARPKVGKTAMGTQLLVKAAKDGFGTAMFSFEMTRQELARRILSSETGISTNRIRRKALSNDEHSLLVETWDRYKEYNINIIDDCGRTPFNIASVCRRIKTIGKLDLIVIDYYQLMDSGQRTSSLPEDLTIVSRNLKRLASDLGLVVILLSQIGTKGGADITAPPSVREVRWSSSVFEDANSFTILHRNSYSEIDDFSAEALVVGNRHGPTDKIKLTFDPKKVVFLERSDL